jgi:soluble lytic murein transglycosylase-like protein/TolA-binding protein
VLRLKKIVLIFILLLCYVVPGVDSGLNRLISSDDEMAAADSLYDAADYSSALSLYKMVIAGSDFNNTPELQFKIAYALYRSGEFEKSAQVFRSLYEKKIIIPDFSRFFYIKSLWHSNPKEAAAESEDYIARYKNNSLDDSLLIPLADYFFKQKKYDDARKYYLIAKRRNFDKSKRAYLRIQAAIAICKSGNEKQAFQEFYQTLKKYKSYSETYELALLIKEKYPDFFEDHFFNIVEVYLANHKYHELRLLLEEYIRNEKDYLKVEKARYYLVRIYYSRGEYRTALYGFSNLLKDLRNKKLEPHIRLYMARIYIRIDRKQQSIDAYLDYAHRYPSRRIAPQAVWKSGWIYEGMGELEKAAAMYKLIIRRWPRKSIAQEAFFRIGLNYYRLQQYEKADSVFDRIKRMNWSDLHITRAQYWQSLCKDKLNDHLSALDLRLKLADDPWMNYYTMKSYIKDRDLADIVSGISDKLRGEIPPENDEELLVDLVNDFEKFFRVQELLGADYANCVLENMRFRANTLTEWINLAEIYKKIGAYHKAYRAYDYINNRYFSDVKYSDKFFILKERFPYYYDDIIEKYAIRHNVPKELVLSVMKRESVFDARAHSFADAYGLMQIIPPTARALARQLGREWNGPQQLFDPEYNIELGTYYLSSLLKQYNNRLELAFSAYNAGPHRVKKWIKLEGSEDQDVYIENIEFKETRNYVRIVLKNYWAYQLLNLSFRS